MGDFYPISPLVGIKNTSYGAQAGVMDEKWAIRVMRGKKVIAEKTMDYLDLDRIVGIIYGHVRLEGLSRHSVAMCAGRLMQFARRYQESGVCPNYEIPDLVRGDSSLPSMESSSVSPASDTISSASTTSEPAAELEQLGTVPLLNPLVGISLWKASSKACAHLLLGLAIYGASLPEGHLEAMVREVANNMIRQWSESNSSTELVKEFTAMIQSCSKENQVPITPQGESAVEVDSCVMLEIANQIDPDRKRIPSKYPCAFHELVAKEVGNLAGLEIEINPGSSGCKMTYRLK